MADIIYRPRRTRRSAAMRDLVAQTVIAPRNLVQPLFVVPGSAIARPIEALSGQMHLSPDKAADLAKEIRAAGIPAVLLFGIPPEKDAVGSYAARADAPVQEAVRRIKDAVPELVVICDLCLCEYTDHGHCGVVREDGSVDNDATLPLLMQAAVSQAEAGADVVAPSDMMDGRVSALRRALDETGFIETAILSYAVKYRSAFYGPFREAAGSAPREGDRSTYQMDFRNGREALREARLDVDEGADMLLVKPGMPYLDVLASVRAATDLPVGAYQVSGEYAMLEAAASRGWLDRDMAVTESLYAMRRAGADFIVTYYALEWARRGLCR
ncbi:MAG: porphobilinogen synthase [Thermaerobacter sp.]|nr:porphobilinogen synthase [Thermaerobacter sp.]